MSAVRAEAAPVVAPILVLAVDLAAVGAEDSDGWSWPVGTDGTDPDLTYCAALVFVRRGRQFVGEVELDLPDGPLDLPGLVRRVRGRFDGQLVPAQVGTQGSLTGVDPPAISVVVPTAMARLAELERCVDSLIACRYPRVEIIVVDNRPGPDPLREAAVARLSQDARVRVVPEPLPGVSAARNRGVQEADGTIIAFTDDDAAVEPTWLSALASRFSAEPRTDCVTGLVLPAELQTPAQVWFERSGAKLEQQYDLVRYAPARAGGRTFAVRPVDADGRPIGRRVPIYRAKFGMGVNMAFRREALAAIGGFDAALGAGTPTQGGEDIAALTTLLHRGGRLTLDPAAAVWHYHRRDLASLQEQMRGYGRGYTAALTALVRHDPRHLVGISQMTTLAVGVMRGRGEARQSTAYPEVLQRSEWRGRLTGAHAYLSARRAVRRWPIPPGAS